MKSIQFFKAIILFAVMLSMSCSKNEGVEPDESGAGGASFFSAKVDNASFPTADIQFTNATFIGVTKMLQIIGQPQDQKETIILNLMPFGGKVSTAADWKPGTYDFDPVHVTRMEYLASAQYNKWNGNTYELWSTKWDYVKSGQITIESNTGTQIKGTFSFDAVRQNTNGSFDAGSIKKISSGRFDLKISTR